MAKISVLIVSRNYGRFLRDCIESVLAQTCREELEIVLVDDGSTDNTADVLRDYPMVRTVFQAYSGVAAARNRALREASGENIAFLDADDLWKKEKLAVQMRYLRDQPDCGIVFTGYENFLEPGVSPDEEWVRRNILFAAKNRTCLPTALFTRDVMLRCGDFDESFTSGEDTEWTARLGFLGVKTGFLEDRLLLRRLHGGNLTRESRTGADAESVAKAFQVIRRNLRLQSRSSAEEGVSVLIPAFRAAEYIGECIESVRKQLPLPYGLPLEIVVADDGSDDGTPEAAEARGARVLQLAHRGSAAARNAALTAAKYGYVYFLDADDRAAPSALGALLRAIRAGGDLTAVFARARDFSVETDGAGARRERFSSRAYSGCLPGCSLIRRRAFQTVGLFNEELRTGETVDWLSRFRESGLPFAELDTVSLERRIHPASTGAVNGEQERRDYARIVREHLKRMNHE